MAPRHIWDPEAWEAPPSPPASQFAKLWHEASRPEKCQLIAIGILLLLAVGHGMAKYAFGLRVASEVILWAGLILFCAALGVAVGIEPYDPEETWNEKEYAPPRHR